MTTRIDRCPRCGGPFPDALDARDYEGICPECLAALAVADGEIEPSAAADPVAQAAKDPPPLKRGAAFRGLEVLELVGQGGMGVVYKARQIELGRTVALKILSPRLAADPEFPRRFNREAQALASLDHPGIVRIHDVGREGDLCFLVMEYVDGSTLRELLVQRRLTPDQALRLVPQLCEALEYAHSRGVIHRDVKPENILVSRSGAAKIADFGLAKMVPDDAVAVSALTGTHVVMGTVNYMSPEQREGRRDADHRADIYALGVVLYELLTGELPVGRFDPPSRRTPVDARVDEVVLRALEKDPDRRYQRASELGRDIARLAGEAPPTPDDCPIVDLASGRRVGVAPGRRLAVRTVACDLVVKGWDRPEFGFQAAGDYQFDPESTTPLLQSGVETSRMELRIPSGADLDLAADEGTARLEGVTGHATVRIPDGALRVDRHDGSLRVQAGLGDVSIDGLRSEYFEVRSRAGNVALHGLELARGRGQVETESGSVDVQAATGASFRYYLESRGGRIDGPASGQIGAGAGWLTVRTGQGTARLSGGPASLPGWRDFVSRLTPRQMEKIGVYVIVNAALLLFFGFVAGTFVPGAIVAIFWGMALGLELWKGYVRGVQLDGRPFAETVPALVRKVLAFIPTPPAQPPPAPPPATRTSGLAAVGLVFAILATLAATGAAVPVLLERSAGHTLTGSDLEFARQCAMGFGAAAFAAGALATLLAIAAEQHVAEAGGALKGHGLARAAAFLAILSLIAVLGIIRPSLQAVQRQADGARATAEAFFKALEERRWDAARNLLHPEIQDLPQADLEALTGPLRARTGARPRVWPGVKVVAGGGAARAACMLGTRFSWAPGWIELDHDGASWRIRRLEDLRTQLRR